MFSMHQLSSPLALAITLLSSTPTLALIPEKGKDYKELETEVTIPDALKYLIGPSDKMPNHTVIQFTSLNCPFCSEFDRELEREVQSSSGLKEKAWRTLFKQARVIKVHRLIRDTDSFNIFDFPVAPLFHSFDLHYRMVSDITEPQWYKFLQNIKNEFGADNLVLLTSQRTKIPELFTQHWLAAIKSNEEAVPPIYSGDWWPAGSLKEWHHSKEYLSKLKITSVRDETIEGLANLTAQATITDTEIPTLLIDGKYLVEPTVLRAKDEELPELDSRHIRYMLEVVKALTKEKD